MKFSVETRRYHASSYDQYLCLRPSLLLWVATVYFSRAIVLPLVARMSSLTGASADTTSLLHGAFGLESLAPALPAFLVLTLLLTRSPSRGRVVRWLFARGRELLVLSALFDIGLHSMDFVASGEQSAGRMLGTILVEAFDVYFLVYAVASKRVRDVFSSFPAPLGPATRG